MKGSSMGSQRVSRRNVLQLSVLLLGAAPILASCSSAPAATPRAPSSPTTAAQPASAPPTVAPTSPPTAAPTAAPITATAAPAATTPAAQSAATSSEKVTIDYWYNSGGDAWKTTQNMVEAFNSAHPSLAIKASSVPQEQGVYPKLETAIAAGTPPTAAYIDRTMVVTFGAKKSLVQLDGYASRDAVAKDQFYGPVWEEVTYQGHLFALPMEADPLMMVFRNKDLFKEAGLDPEVPPKTLEDLDQMAARLTKPSSKGYDQVGYIPWHGMGFGFWPFGHAFGGSYYDAATDKVTANDPKNVQGMTWVQSYAKRYDIKKLAASVEQGQGGFADPFYKGREAMILQGIWFLGNLKQYAPKINYDWSPFPGSQSFGKSSNYVLGESVAIPRGAQHPDAGWEWIKYLATPPGIVEWCKTNSYLPAHVAAGKDKGFADDPQYKRMVDFMSQTYDHAPAIPAVGLYYSLIQQAQEDVIYGRKEPKPALDYVTQKVQEEEDKYAKAQ